MNLNLVRQFCRESEPLAVRRTETADRRIADYLVPVNAVGDRHPTIALLGVPQDEGVRRNGGRVGAAAAPAAIRRALAKLTASIGTAMLPENTTILDCGDVRTEGLSLEEIHRRQQEVVGALLDAGLVVIVLGGGHDVALPNGRALGARSQRLGIVNVDAHLDVRPPTLEGTHSGSPFRELIEDATCRVEQLVEFGIHAFSASAHHVRYVLERGYVVWTLEQIRRQTLASSLEQVVGSLVECGGIHFSLDMDALASAYAPGVSAPASDGFRPDEVATIIERIVALPACRIVDIVEVNPRTDTDERTARLAAYFAALMIWTIAHRTVCR
ncbi:MAG: arginase [Candidatus Kapaibacterium sp.]|nr:MAG: arginase [Candidatus Kapabacteria bacterium]